MDMAGNAAEWCADPYPIDRLEDPLRWNGLQPLGPPPFVVKGGAFTEEWLRLRLDGRWAIPGDARERWVGFRVAVAI